ncbi:uncharacterized protein LOC100370804 [Saccoglossus kowalevskii]|uniref:Uncharacterized protein LOC100370804 n=1 Tax=Saccoglossus kowalevskii TaxID=10224 RepID=A0ABM0GQC4_SACKO|nr:PREDICTED: uncharacterized protein LOC100370804 [Saccoglossus kowalevskii]
MRTTIMLIFSAVLVAVLFTHTSAQPQCCRGVGCKIPPNCKCPFQSIICDNPTKNVLTAGKRNYLPISKSNELSTYQRPVSDAKTNVVTSDDIVNLIRSSPSLIRKIVKAIDLNGDDMISKAELQSLVYD